MTSSLHFCQTVWSYLVISGILCFVTIYDLNVSRRMLYRAFISSFSVGGRKSITYQETAVFNSWRYLVRGDRRICIFKTFFCSIQAIPGSVIFWKVTEIIPSIERGRCMLLWALEKSRSASLTVAPFPHHFEYVSFHWSQSTAKLLNNTALSI